MVQQCFFVIIFKFDLKFYPPNDISALVAWQCKETTPTLGNKLYQGCIWSLKFRSLDDVVTNSVLVIVSCQELVI